jgi:hypothetical protein
MIRFKSSINISFFIIIIIFLFTKCGEELFTKCGEEFGSSEFYINNQSDSNLYSIIIPLHDAADWDTLLISSKSSVKIFTEGFISSVPPNPSESIDRIILYTSIDNSINRKMVYLFYPVTNDRWETIEYNERKGGTRVVYELLIENSDLDLN